MNEEIYNPERSLIYNYLRKNYDKYPSDAKALNAISDFSLCWAVFDNKCQNYLPDVVEGATIGLCEINRIWHQLTSNTFDSNEVRDAFFFWKKRFYSDGCANQHLDDLFPEKSKNRGKNELIQHFKSSKKSSSHLHACLIVTYRLRSNLFHGVKAGYGFENQAENFEHSTKVMISIMNEIGTE